MVAEVVAGNTMLALKEWLTQEHPVEDFIQLLKDIHGIIFELNETSMPLVEKLGIERDSITKVLDTPHLQAQFCRLVFSYISKLFTQNGEIKGIPWTLLYKTILKQSSDATILNLVDCLALAKDFHTLSQTKIADCFQYAIQNGYVSLIIWNQCLVKPMKESDDGKCIYDPTVQMQWNQLIQCLVSLPDKISNQLKLKTSSLFHPTLYFAKLATDISEVLMKVYTSLQESHDCSLTFVSQLFGKICATGNAVVMYDILIPQITRWTKETPLWCRICSKLFLLIPDALLESCVEPLIKCVQNADLLGRLFSDSILTRAKCKFLFMHKFLFTRMYEDDGIPYSILAYLAGNVALERYFKEIVLKLLDVWGERNSIKHTSYEQHMYISRCLLMALSLLNTQQKEAWKSELTLKLLEAVPAHLESPNEKLHHIGMIVAQCLTTVVNKDGKQLNFELEKTDNVEYLFKLSVNPSVAIREKKEKNKKNNDENEMDEVSNKKENICKDTKSHCSNESKTLEDEEEEEEEGEEEEELDSDDDLVPYNLDEEELSSSVNGVRAPVHLRECISGLLSPKDPNRLEACLRVVKKLVMREPGDLFDVSVELVKILLHLTNEYNIQNFIQIRMDAMVEITVKCPVQVVQFLAEQFYTENYSLIHRSDIMEVISSSAVRLSSAVREKSANEMRAHLPLPSIPGQVTINEKPKWQEIIDERVKSKTRRFTNGPTNELPRAKKNRFTDVAGIFFFPLLKKFGTRLDTCDMFGKDSFILGKFVYTLCVVLQSSHGLPIISVMGRSLFDVIWSLRFHKEAYVRQSVIYACTMITLHLPPFCLITDLRSEMFEARDWLQELLQQDPNEECRKLAGTCLVLMQKTMQNELVGNG